MLKYDDDYYYCPTWFIAREILAESISQLDRNFYPSSFSPPKTKFSIPRSRSSPESPSCYNASDDAQKQMLALIKSSIGTKFVIRWADLMYSLALDAVRTVSADDVGMRTVDIKRYARAGKVLGGEIESSHVFSGVILNKDIVHSQMHRRDTQAARLAPFDCSLKYKTGESQTNIEISKEADFARINMIKEEQVKVMVDHILEFKPDLVITEKVILGVPFRLCRVLIADCPPCRTDCVQMAISVGLHARTLVQVGTHLTALRMSCLPLRCNFL
jgi:T-complex protein 1 subunit gamma